MVPTSPLGSLMGGPGGGGNPPLTMDKAILARDALTGIVGNRYTDMKDQNAKNNFSYLNNLLGRETTQKLISHVMVHNNREDMKKASPADRVQAFYSMGSRDPDIDNLLKQFGSMGAGPVGGLNSSPDLSNMIASGRDTSSARPVVAPNMKEISALMQKIR